MRYLLKTVRQSQSNDISIEALKCLGEIGPLNLQQMCYYFDADNNMETVVLLRYSYIHYLY